jgi:hypothetical protein
MTMRRILAGVLSPAFLLASLLGAAGSQEKKSPIPDPAAQKDAES